MEDVTLTPSDSPGGVNYPSWRAGVWPDTGDSPKNSQNNHLGLHSFVGFPTWKLTWQWKNNNLKMYLLSKMVIFYCHVSFPGSFPPSSDDQMRNPRFSFSGRSFPGSKWSFGAMERRCIWAPGGACVNRFFPQRTDRWNFHCKFHVLFPTPELDLCIQYTIIKSDCIFGIRVHNNSVFMQYIICHSILV